MQELEIKILAKSKSSKNKEAITLKEHTKGLLQQLKNLKFKVCKEFVDYNLLKFAIYSHDLGKVAPSFQISVGNWDYKPKVPFPEIPHSVFSLLWINKNKLSNEFSSEEDIKILLSVIAFHHWRDNFHNIILGNDDKFKRVISELLKNKTLKYQLLQNLTKHFSDSDKEFSYYLNFLSFDADLALAISEGNDLFPYVIPPYYSYFLPQRISLNEEFKKKWIYTAG
ncbi:MAG: CRISPR-associated endonuclease Cas3'', partial [Thermodesulfovibrio sp.]|nr:CRISPR-associated endonuclease Cas3'' [Thermodesulfovibrio sp.]